MDGKVREMLGKITRRKVQVHMAQNRRHNKQSHKLPKGGPMTKYTLYCRCAECGQERNILADFTKKIGGLLYLYCRRCGISTWHTVFHWKHNSIKM